MRHLAFSLVIVAGLSMFGCSATHSSPTLSDERPTTTGPEKTCYKDSRSDGHVCTEIPSAS